MKRLEANRAEINIYIYAERNRDRAKYIFIAKVSQCSSYNLIKRR